MMTLAFLLFFFNQTILQEVVKYMNIDKILPSHKYSITVRYEQQNCIRKKQLNVSITLLLFYTIIIVV